jgi:hypothetical protein
MTEVYWRQKDGRMISVDDMDITHLRNTLKMIIRNSQGQIVPRRQFVPNGELASEDYDRFVMHGSTHQNHDEYDNIL